MATSGRGSEEQFYEKVRKRTADAWRKQYLTSEHEKVKAEKLVDRLRTKPESVYSLNNVLWLLFSIGVFYFTDFAIAVLYDIRVDRWWLYAGTSCLSISVLCCFYCIIWLSWVKGIHSDKWEEHNAFVIPIATAAAFIGGAIVCYSLWPIWGILTLPIVGSQFMGFVVIVAMVPDIF